MKIIALIPALLAFACTSKTDHQGKNLYSPTELVSFDYPREIDSLKLTDLFDSAKWYIYARNCDRYYKPQSNVSDSVPFGYLELRFLSFYVTHDTVILSFNFMDKGKAILPNMTRDLAQITAGVGFNMETKEKIFNVSPGSYYSEHGDDPSSRYFNPLQPEVLAFIKKNENEINPWFRIQAKRRKII